jgi:hypothetical protein
MKFITLFLLETTFKLVINLLLFHSNISLRSISQKNECVYILHRVYYIHFSYSNDRHYFFNVRYCSLPSEILLHIREIPGLIH